MLVVPSPFASGLAVLQPVRVAVELSHDTDSEHTAIVIGSRPGLLPSRPHPRPLRSAGPGWVPCRRRTCLPTLPVAFVVLPSMVPVQLRAGGETLEVAVSETEGFVGKDGRPVGKDGRVVAANGDAHVLAEGPNGVITATFEPRSQTLDLPGGGQVTLAQQGEGDWRIGEDRVRNGHRYVAGGHEYVLELVDGRWRTAAYSAWNVRPWTSIGAEGVRPGSPYGLAIDAKGVVYVADLKAHVVLRVAPAGTVTTLAGMWWENGNGGPATEARLNSPSGVAVDAAGNVCVADRFNHRVRRIDGAGTITTLAGTGEEGYGGDGGPYAEDAVLGPGAREADGAGIIDLLDSIGSATPRMSKIGLASPVTTSVGDAPGSRSLQRQAPNRARC